MKAGRELDALIAEKVMGHDVKTWNEVYEVAKRKEDIPVIMLEEKQCRSVPRYSADISHAWKVVDMLKDRFLFRLTQSGEGNWWAEFDNFSADGRVYEESAPLAICLAALKAVGVEVDA